MRLLQWRKLHRHVLETMGPRLGVQHLFLQPAHHDVQRFGIDPGSILRVLTVIFKLDGRRAAAEPDVEPSAAEVIEHADLLDHPQRMMQRERIDHRAEPQALGALRGRGEKHAG